MFFKTSSLPKYCGKFCAGILLLLLPIYTWRRLFKTLRQLRLQYEEKQLFYKRHNCCVMYFKSRGMSGWPPHNQRIQVSLKDGNLMYEPIMYFLQTATRTLDIAIMMIHVNVFYDVLLEACLAGVKIRLLLDHTASSHNPQVKKLQKAGVCVRYFVSVHPEYESIMHHKYAIKDYAVDEGYLVFGSINWTSAAHLQNYEDVVFSTDIELVRAFNESFLEMWEFVGGFCRDDLQINEILKIT